MFFAAAARAAGLGFPTLGIWGRLDWTIDSGGVSPVIGVESPAIALAPRATLLNAPIAKPMAEGISKSFAPQVEKRESVKRPPY